jgi:TPR repeat protein
MRSALKAVTALIGLGLLATPACAATEVEQLIAKAKLGNVAAQLELGQAYRMGLMRMADGSTVEKNLPEAARWLSEAAKKDLRAKAWLAGLYSSYDFENRDDAAAAILFDEIVRGDIAEKDLLTRAQYALGELLYQECTGYLISLDCGPNKTSPFKNDQNAAHWFELAAKQGNQKAQFQLATMYEHGRGVPQDFLEAAKLYQAAGEAGHEEAHVMLGELYLRMENPVSAYMWFNIGAAENRPQAAERRDKLTPRMTTAQLTEAQKLTREYRAAHPTGPKRF